MLIIYWISIYSYSIKSIYVFPIFIFVLLNLLRLLKRQHILQYQAILLSIENNETLRFIVILMTEFSFWSKLSICYNNAVVCLKELKLQVKAKMYFRITPAVKTTDLSNKQAEDKDSICKCTLFYGERLPTVHIYSSLTVCSWESCWNTHLRVTV